MKRSPTASHSRLRAEELAQLIEALPRSGTEERLCAELAAQLRDLAEVDVVDILWRRGANTLTLVASTIAPEYAGRILIGRHVGIIGEAVRSKEPVLIPSGFDCKGAYTNYPGSESTRCEAGLAVPLLGEDEAQGVVLFRKGTAWKPSPATLGRLLEACQVVGSLIRGFRTAYDAGSRVSRIGAVSEVSRILAQSPYLEEILQLLVNITAEQFQYDVCTVRLLDENSQELILRAVQSRGLPFQRKLAVRLDESAAGRAILENRSITVSDIVVDDEQNIDELSSEPGLPLRSMICVPLTIGDRPIGVLVCYTIELRQFPEDEVRALETIAKQAALAIEHAKLQVRRTLMQEMHHRVKNNLQQVVSLLRLQVRSASYRTLEEAVEDSMKRILAISSVHDLLSREDLDHVGLLTIAGSIVNQHQALIFPGKSVRFQIRGEDVRLSFVQATQVALILNELIQNALEHGFQSTNEGDVHITVETSGEMVSLWVSNNGDGLPEGFNVRRDAHLGLKIVENLVSALGGTFALSSQLGWTVAEARFQRTRPE